MILDPIVIVPAFNEEGTIAAVVKGALKYAKVVIVIDDGSKDQTAEAAMRAHAVVLRHSSNLGKGAALTTAFVHAAVNYPEAGVLVVLDGDGQHNPEEIPAFLDAYGKTGADMIIGERLVNCRAAPWLRRFGNRFFSWLIFKKTGYRVRDSQSGFRLLSKKYISRAELKSKDYGIETEMIIKAARADFGIVLVPIDTIYKSKCPARPLKDLRIIFSILRAILSAS